MSAQEFYRPILKPARDPKYAPTLSCKIANRNSQLDVEFWNDDPVPQRMNVTDVGKNCHCVAIIRARGLYFIGKRNFGCTFELVMAKIYNDGKLKGYSFVGLEEDSKLPSDPVTGLPVIPNAPTTASLVGDTVLGKRGAPTPDDTAPPSKLRTVEELF